MLRRSQALRPYSKSSNNKLVDILPSGTVVIAGLQTSGRGRGSNNWISSPGSVQFSILIKESQVLSGLVFVQYLFGLAVVKYLCERTGLTIRLKWPNDIYASLHESREPKEYKKLGGILVHGSYSGQRGTECRLVIGCGLNNKSSPAPDHSSISLKDLVNDRYRRGSCHTPCLESEELIAGICKTFDAMWHQFLLQSFQPFEAAYLEKWLHTGQIITEEKTGQKLKIIGLSPKYGMLRTEKVPQHTDEYYFHKQIVDLQPDSNSFDMFSGLIKTKET